MNQRRHKTLRSRHAAIGLALLCVALSSTPAGAQEVTTLIQFTNIWKYDQSGRELGTAWRTNDYDDSKWISGRGLLGFEDNFQPYVIHAPLSTPLTVSLTVTTFYFRTTFEFTGGTAGLSLIATNLVDDGCAIYLNGVRVGDVRALVPSYNATTTFAPPANEGQLDVVAITNLTSLREGVNILAAEVHQAANTSADIMWGMKLIAIRQLPLVITNQPQSQTVTVGETVRLSVGVSGGANYYRWERGGALLPSTSNSLTIANVQLANSGGYRVIISNDVSTVTSTVATVTVIADLTGPKLLAAIGDNTPNGGGTPFGSNTINVLFDEPVNATGARNSNNYILTRLGTTDTIPLLSILYSTALGALLNVDPTDPDWIPGGDYVVTVNNVRDTRGNVLAPGSQIAVAWPRVSSTNVSLADSVWSFHTSAVFDPGVYDEPWQAPDYVEGSWWAQGQGLFYGGAVALAPCFSAFRTATGFQPEPSLFRTAFLWPADWRTSLQLRFTTIYDDGLVLYLNGTEIYRANVTPGSPSSVTRAATAVTFCSTNLTITVTNLLAGTNWLAAAVAQTSLTTEGDCIFGIGSLDATVTDLIAPSLPESLPPVLDATAMGTNSVRLSWSGGGYALESTTNLNLGPASYPLGPWQQVPNMSNPYTNRTDEPYRFFRLKK